MTTTIDIMRDLTGRISEQIGYDVKFFFGSTTSVVNYIQRLNEGGETAIYPAIVIFTEGLTENQSNYHIEFSILKMAIVCNTIYSLTEIERKELVFDKIVYPIFELFQKECKLLNPETTINRIDIPFVNENKTNTFVDLVDGCLIKNLSMKIEKTIFVM